MRSYKISFIPPKNPITLIASGSVPAEIDLTFPKGYVFNPGILRYEKVVREKIGSRIILADHGLNQKYSTKEIIRLQLHLGNWLVIPDVLNSAPIENLLEHYFKWYFEVFPYTCVAILKKFNKKPSVSEFFESMDDLLDWGAADWGLSNILNREIKIMFTLHGDSAEDYIRIFRGLMEEVLCDVEAMNPLLEKMRISFNHWDYRFLLDKFIFAIGGLRKKPAKHQVHIISTVSSYIYKYFLKKYYPLIHIHVFGAGTSAKVIETMIRYGVTSNDISTIPYIAGMGLKLKYNPRLNILRRIRFIPEGQKIKKSLKDQITEESLREIQRFKENTLDRIINSKSITQTSLKTFFTEYEQN